MKFYKDRIELLEAEATKLQAKDRQVSIIRLITLASGVYLLYKGFQSEFWFLHIATIPVAIAFLLLVKQHGNIRWRSKLVGEQIRINKEELVFLTGNSSAFDPGDAFVAADHPYSYDLDFFGPNSIYKHLNRTSTYRGGQELADGLLNIQSKQEIEENQEAIQELSHQAEWRQQLLALGSIYPDSKDSYEALIEWSKHTPDRLSVFIRWMAIILPFLTVGCFGIYFIAQDQMFWRFGLLGVVINLGVLGGFAKRIKEEIISSTEIERILKQYAHMFTLIESTRFKSPLLNKLADSLKKERHQASKSIHQLSLLFGRMEHVANVFASPLLNGLLLFHLHVLDGLAKWKQQYSAQIAPWLTVIGKFEKLSSLANFAYNNPMFVFPTINDEHQIHFEDLGHPLLDKQKAVTNSISFADQRFFILTGSNMSGKSTFLRTVGVNMVLGAIGAPIFASKANIHPLPVYVSMRLSDSLTDSESYFYAEVKRLKGIMEALDNEPCFVLLDEILRGTNSDDKRDGTIEVIRKMAQKQAYGGIATHDLEVCKVAEEHPDILTNKRFEVEIVKDELVFDYKLQSGVCQNKSASFIMKKMKII